MNTWIWGPPKWKFLHTLSFSPQAQEHAEDIALFLECLGVVLPCVFCRESFVTFVHQLQRQMGNMSLVEIIQSAQLSLWMYKLHEMINDKLNMQAIKTLVYDDTNETVPVPGTMSLPEKQSPLRQQSSFSLFEQTPLTSSASDSTLGNARVGTARLRADRSPAQHQQHQQRAFIEQSLRSLLRQRQIAFPCLVKRFQVRPIAFCDSDIWDVLKIFALNVDNRLKQNDDAGEPVWQAQWHAHAHLGVGGTTQFTNEKAEIVRSWLKYVYLLPRMVHIAGGSVALVVALEHCSNMMRRRSTFLGAARSQAFLGAASNKCNVHSFFSVVVIAQNKQKGCGCTRGTSQIVVDPETSFATDGSVESDYELYSKVQAGTCKDGSCK